MQPEVDSVPGATVPPPSPPLGQQYNQFDRWRLCWEANLSFHEPAPAGRQTCVVCRTFADAPSTPNTFRSAVWRFTRCRARHRLPGVPTAAGAGADAGPDDAVPDPGAPVVCAKCDQTYLLDIISSRRRCGKANCRRLLRIDENAIRARMVSTMSPVLAPFLELVAKTRWYECLVHGDLVDCLTDSGPLARGCNHDRNVCDACIRIDFEAKICSDRLRDLCCPDPDCRQTISSLRIRELISEATREIYDKKMTIETVANLPNFRWCKCGSSQVHTAGASVPEWHCIACNRRQCFLCPELDGAPCEHLSADVDPDAAAEQQRSAEAVKANWAEICRITKQCPRRGCGVRIQFKSGCAHMTCRRCRTDFCWACKTIWPAAVATHLLTCPLATDATKTAREDLDLSLYIYRWDQDPGYDSALDGDLWLQDAHR